MIDLFYKKINRTLNAILKHYPTRVLPRGPDEPERRLISNLFSYMGELKKLKNEQRIRYQDPSPDAI